MNYRRYAMWMCVIGLLDLEAGQAAGGETSNDVVTAGTTLRQTSPSGTAYIMGKLGVGTGTPGSALDVRGNANVEGAFQVPCQGDVGMGPYVNGPSEKGITSSNVILNGNWVSADGENEGVYVAPNGNVGIGVSTPGARLTVGGSLQLESGVSANEISTDGTLGDNSDTALPTEQAVRTFVTGYANTNHVVLFAFMTNGPFTVKAGREAVVTNNAEDWDSAAAYNPTTGIFTTPSAGYYWVNAEVTTYANTGTANRIYLRLYQNGACMALGDQQTSEIRHQHGVTAILNLAQGTPVKVTIQPSKSDINLENVVRSSRLSIMKIRDL